MKEVDAIKDLVINLERIYGIPKNEINEKINIKLMTILAKFDHEKLNSYYRGYRDGINDARKK